MKLELLPKPVFEKSRAEAEFYNDHFNVAEATEPFSTEFGRSSFGNGKKYGLAAMEMR